MFTGTADGGVDAANLRALRQLAGSEAGPDAAPDAAQRSSDCRRRLLTATTEVGSTNRVRLAEDGSRIGGCVAAGARCGPSTATR